MAGQAPLFRLLPPNVENNPLRQLLGQVDDGLIDLDPPYQRGSVWGAERRRNLIRSLTMGIPVGNLFVNRRDWESPGSVVDGKQRLLAGAAWLADEVEVPRSWFAASDLRDGSLHGRCVWSDLTDASQRRWQNIALIPVVLTNFETVEAEAALFELINFGGVPQGESDRDA